MARAKGGEVFISGTVKDIVPGSSLSFEDHSTHELKGVAGRGGVIALRTVFGRTPFATLCAA